MHHKNAVKECVFVATFIIGLVILFGGAALHGRFCEKVFGPDDRQRDLMEARQTAMYLIRRMTNLSLNDIGKEFGDRDHTTVLHSLDQVEKKMRSDPAYAEKVKEITTNINNKK